MQDFNKEVESCNAFFIELLPPPDIEPAAFVSLIIRYTKSLFLCISFLPLLKRTFVNLICLINTDNLNLYGFTNRDLGLIYILETDDMSKGYHLLILCNLNPYRKRIPSIRRFIYKYFQS